MIRLLNLIKKKSNILTLFTLSIITILSLLPLDELPPVPGTDKTHHIIAYAILMFPIALRKSERWILFGLFFIAYGGMIELIQPYVNRYGDWLDMAANATGIACGFILAELINNLSQTVLNRSR